MTYLNKRPSCNSTLNTVLNVESINYDFGNCNAFRCISCDYKDKIFDIDNGHNCMEWSKCELIIDKSSLHPIDQFIGYNDRSFFTKWNETVVA